MYAQGSRLLPASSDADNCQWHWQPPYGLLIDVTGGSPPVLNSPVENFLLHRKIDPLFRRIRIDPQSAKLNENILLVLCHPLALEQVLLPRGHNHFHTKLIRLFQILVQMPPVRTVLQKDQSSVAHQFDAFVSACRIDIKFCCN